MIRERPAVVDVSCSSMFQVTSALVVIFDLVHQSWTSALSADPRTIRGSWSRGGRHELRPQSRIQWRSPEQPRGHPFKGRCFRLYCIYIYRLFLSVCYFNHVKESTTEYFGAGRILAGPNSCLQRQQSLCLFH